MKTKISISIDEHLLKLIDLAAETFNTTRSEMINKTLQSSALEIRNQLDEIYYEEIKMRDFTLLNGGVESSD